MSDNQHTFSDDKQDSQRPSYHWQVAFHGLHKDVKEIGSLSNILTLILFLVGPAIGAYMNTQKYMVYGIASAITIAVWWVAVRLVSHNSTPPVAVSQSIKDTLSAKSDSSEPLAAPRKKNIPRKPESKKIVPQQTVPDLPVEKLVFVSQPISSPNQELPFALDVTIQTNVLINSPHIRVECDGLIKDAKFRIIGVSAFLSVQTRIAGNIYEFSCGYPSLTPQNPLVITIFSVTKINVIRVSHVF